MHRRDTGRGRSTTSWYGRPPGVLWDNLPGSLNNSSGLNSRTGTADVDQPHDGTGVGTPSKATTRVRARDGRPWARRSSCRKNGFPQTPGTEAVAEIGSSSWL